VSAGVYHDVQHSVQVTAVLRWAAGAGEVDTLALERRRTLVRVP